MIAVSEEIIVITTNATIINKFTNKLISSFTDLLYMQFVFYNIQLIVLHSP